MWEVLLSSNFFSFQVIVLGWADCAFSILLTQTPFGYELGREFRSYPDRKIGQSKILNCRCDAKSDLLDGMGRTHSFYSLEYVLWNGLQGKVIDLTSRQSSPKVWGTIKGSDILRYFLSFVFLEWVRFVGLCIVEYDLSGTGVEAANSLSDWLLAAHSHCVTKNIFLRETASWMHIREPYVRGFPRSTPTGGG